jgi:nucleoside-diphosphate-sugar epimerase
LSFRPVPPDDPVRRRPDITLARTRLGWEPKTPLRRGLAITIEHFRGQPGIADA